MKDHIYSLHILNLLTAQISDYKGALDVLERNPYQAPYINNILSYSLHNSIIILAKRFVDEWTSNLIIEEDSKAKETLARCKKEAEPVIERLKQWDLDDYANIALAHTFRYSLNNTDPSSIGQGHGKLAIPENLFECELLKRCIQRAASIVTPPFREELEATRMEMFGEDPASQKTIEGRITSDTQLQQELINIETQIQRKQEQ